MSKTISFQSCPNCGASLPPDSPHELCPACLLRQALASRTIPDDVSSKANPVPPPTPAEIADKFPQFDVTECLGRGGMGVVYKARQKSLDRWVAIKILAPERVGEGKFSERFAREAQTLAHLSHPNIVTVFDYGETCGLYYIVMEYVDGVNLRDLIREGKLEPRQALAIVPPICEALQFAHDKGVVHRDIKPENLLLDRDGRVKIADFGIASLIGARGEFSGTPPYMAPEQGKASQSVDHRADIYALGVVLYEMLTGERPDREVLAPSKKVHVDVRIDEVVLRALDRDPERRYQTVQDVNTRVQTILENDKSTPVSRMDWLSSKCHPNALQRVLAFLIDCCAVSLAFLPIVGVFALMFRHVQLRDGLLLLQLCLIIYWSVMECGPWQASLGKKAFGIIVCDIDGKRISLLRSLARNFCKFLSWAFCMVGFVMPLFTRRRQALHDMLAECYLVKDRPASVTNNPPSVFHRLLWYGAVAAMVAASFVTVVFLRRSTFEMSAKKTIQVNTQQKTQKLLSQEKAVSECEEPKLFREFDKLLSREKAVYGWLEWKKRNWENAIRFFQKSIDVDPENANAWNGIGWSYFNSGRLADANTAFQRAVGIDPQCTFALTGLGLTYLHLRNDVLAEKYFREAAPNSDVATFGLACVYLLQGKYAEAEKPAQKIIESIEVGDTTKRMPETAKNKDVADDLMREVGDTAKRMLEAAKNKHVPDDLMKLLAPDRADTRNEHKDEDIRNAADIWLKKVDQGSYDASWDDASERLQKTVSRPVWIDQLKKIREPLGMLTSRKFATIQQTNELPGLPDGRYAVLQCDSEFAQLPKARETLTFVANPQGIWKVLSYLVIPLGISADAQLAMDQWLAGVDAGRYEESWKSADTFLQQSVSQADWVKAMDDYRKPLGTLISRKLESSQNVPNLPGAPEGEYMVCKFRSRFANKADATETVTIRKGPDSRWGMAGYFIK